MAGRQEQINLDTLTPQQLTSIKKQLDEEVEHLSSSCMTLAGAHAKFKECLRCVLTQAASPPDERKSVLIPLTNSLYVSGTLSDPSKVLVDVGTGFYIEKNVKSATSFYEGKVKELGANISDLEQIVQGKTSNLRVVEEVLRQKMQAAS